MHDWLAGDVETYDWLARLSVLMRFCPPLQAGSLGLAGGMTALFLAVQEKDDEIVDMLRQVKITTSPLHSLYSFLDFFVTFSLPFRHLFGIFLKPFRELFETFSELFLNFFGMFLDRKVF